MASPTMHLSETLKANGWLRTSALDPSAYERHGHTFVTWRKNLVTIASSSDELFFDPKYNSVCKAHSSGCSTTIEAIVVPIEHRHQGLARAALNEWVRIAKDSLVTLYLEPHPLDEHTTLNDLMRMYSACGFTPQDNHQRILIAGHLEP